MTSEPGPLPPQPARKAAATTAKANLVMSMRLVFILSFGSIDATASYLIRDQDSNPPLIEQHTRSREARLTR